MLHLDPERLAALADGDATAEEAEHLAQCAGCWREREAQRALVSLAADARAQLSPPLTTWESIAGELREQQMLLPPLARRRPMWVRALGQAAAAVVLVAGGVVAGRRSVDTSNMAAATSADSVASTFASAKDAKQVLERANRQYQLAAAFLSALDTTSRGASQPEMYRTRLAALDAVAGIARAAVNEAPQDPVINQYYLAAINARQVALQQLNGSLPSGQTLAGF
ncbi:MAG: hypothetical protein M3081_21480 [Gemmatimonadota bacterium]|nr:hypothetical protein [Gemmatimonadota bacterium]